MFFLIYFFMWIDKLNLNLFYCSHCQYMVFVCKSALFCKLMQLNKALEQQNVSWLQHQPPSLGPGMCPFMFDSEKSFSFSFFFLRQRMKIGLVVVFYCVIPVKPSIPKCWLEGEDQDREIVLLRCRSEEGSNPLTYSWRRSTGELPRTAVQSKCDLHWHHGVTDRPHQGQGVCLMLTP